MTARGGDARPSIRQDLDQLIFARLLFEELRKHTAFETDFVALRRRWTRLVRTLDHVRAMPQSTRLLEQYFEQVLSPTPVRYPRERDVTGEDAIELRRRADVVERCLHRLFNLLWPGGRGWENEPGNDWHQRWRFNEIARRQYAWAKESHRRLNQKAWSHDERLSSRSQVRRYVDEIARFCAKWHLKAPWAASAIIGHHALFASFGDAGVLSFAMPDVYGPPPSVRINVRLPGRTSEDFARDRERLDAITHLQAETEKLHLAVHWPIRDRMLQHIEEEIDSACVTLAWNGHPSDPIPLILEACESRLGRPLKLREQRDLRSQSRRQIQAARQEFASSGFRPISMADHQIHARWVAAVLIDPNRSWDEIAKSDEPHAGALTGTNVRLQANAFAESAGLELPRVRAVRRVIRR